MNQNHQQSGIIDPPHTRRNLKALENAIVRQFDIPQEIIDAAPKVLGRIMATGSNRERIAATRCLVAMQRATQPNIQAHLHQHQTAPAVGTEPETADEDFDLERARQKNFERIERLGRLGGFSE